MSNPRISIIVAIDEKRGIGKNNDLLFKIPADHVRVRTVTRGHPLVMGRKTFESLGRLLPNRTHIVITRDPSSLKELSYQPHVIVSSLEEGIARAKEAPGADEIFIFGGGQIFTEAIEKDLVDKLYLTIVKGDYHADTFFPAYQKFTKVLEHEDHDEEGYHFSFVTCEKA
jgi:dihydrofolate reductase